MDNEKREEWEDLLSAPLPGQRVITERQVELEGADFMAAMQMHQQLTGG